MLVLRTRRLVSITSIRLSSTVRKMSDEQVIPPSLKAIATEVCQLLKERNETISVAETAAGGLISAALLSTAGASKVYKGGLTVGQLMQP